MKTLAKILILAASGAALLPIVAPGDPAKTAPAPAKPAVVKPAPVRSIFVIPTSSREGRDFFYPESLRPYEALTAAAGSVVESSALICKGVLGTPGHFVAIINNHAFAPGDEGEVKTKGIPVTIRCVEIRNNLVVIEINGQRRELMIEAR